jgi:uncharacterized membrane protein YphA (DoxX/SURF4 family)
MERRLVKGLEPWLPWPLCRWKWWTEPVRAERLAALRIGLAAVLFVDILCTYLPQMHVFFGGDSLAAPDVFAWRFREPRWYWSLFYGVESAWMLRAAAVVWAFSTLCLLLGFATRTSAVITWLLSTSFATLNPHIDNAGDSIRGIILFYLMLCPCGAAWSLDAWKERASARRLPVYVHPWPLRLLFVQMTLIYFMNGTYKLLGANWVHGNSLYYVLGDLTLARWSYAQFPVPYWLTRLLTWAVLAWEAGFPLWVALPRTRTAALWFGVAFHLGIGVSLELGGFAFYALCLYLPLLPWERWAVGPGARAFQVRSAGVGSSGVKR